MHAVSVLLITHRIRAPTRIRVLITSAPGHRKHWSSISMHILRIHPSASMGLRLMQAHSRG